MPFSNDEATTHKSDLMSPPMTPKYNFDATIQSPHDRALENETTFLHPLSHNGSTRRRCSRKTSLPHSFRAMKLVNCDTLDTIGRRFSLPFEQPSPSRPRPRPRPCQLDSSPRKKSIPKRSPSLVTTSAAAGGVFTMNVFDRPRKSSERPQAILSPVPSPTETTITIASPISLPSPPCTDKPKPDTFFYDNVDLSIDDKAIFDSPWLPAWEPFDKKPAIRVTWKGSPLSIHSLAYYDTLHSNERSIASTLRLSPEQYLKCKRAMILSARVFYQHGLPFRKSDAQKTCRIDVNKISCLWGAFNRLGWFHPR